MLFLLILYLVLPISIVLSDSFLQRITAALARGVIHGQHVGHWHLDLDVMDGVKDKAAAGAKKLKARAHFLANVFG